LVGVESHRLHCPASKQALLCCQQPRVLQLPLLITTTGRVNRPEQATTLISSLINKTLPPTAAGLLHLKQLPFYKNCLQPSISAAQPLSTLSVSSSIPTLCTLAMTNWTKPIPILAQILPNHTHPILSKPFTHFLNSSTQFFTYPTLHPLLTY